MTNDLKSGALTALALIAFASNSLLTRLALGSHQIDAATFTSIRLVAGAVVLALIVRAKAGGWTPLRPQGATGPFALFAYAAPFSFAYLRIGAAVGALVLFGVVQLTMLGYGILRGERLSLAAWAGLMLALLGFGLLTIPSATRPDVIGLMLMTTAGIAWALYSLSGRTATDPVAANARSFLWSSPLAVLLSLVSRTAAMANGRTIALALVSGAVTSGLGYAVWYRALPRLTITQAAVAQLCVPVIAALGAVAFLGESVSARLLVSGAAVLGGVALVVSARVRERV